MISDTEHLFMCLMTIHMSSLERYLLKSFAHSPSILTGHLPLPQGLSTSCRPFLKGSCLDLPVTDFLFWGFISNVTPDHPLWNHPPQYFLSHYLALFFMTLVAKLTSSLQCIWAWSVAAPWKRSSERSQSSLSCSAVSTSMEGKSLLIFVVIINGFFYGNSFAYLSLYLLPSLSLFRITF